MFYHRSRLIDSLFDFNFHSRRCVDPAPTVFDSRARPADGLSRPGNIGREQVAATIKSVKPRPSISAGAQIAAAAAGDGKIRCRRDSLFPIRGSPLFEPAFSSTSILRVYHSLSTVRSLVFPCPWFSLVMGSAVAALGRVAVFRLINMNFEGNIRNVLG